MRYKPGAPWAVCWSAGAGVVGTPSSVLDVEYDHLLSALDAMTSAAPVRSLGRFLLSSSAGGIHASDTDEICTEATTPSPTSAYGEHKLRQEVAVASWAQATEITSLLARISNVYGPGQDMTKPQGFISHLCRAMVRRETFMLTVPSDTVRDFVFSRDVGRKMALWLEGGAPTDREPVSRKLIVSGRSTTLQHVISRVTAISRVPSRIMVSPRPRSKDQPRRTRFRSTALLSLDAAVPWTSLEEGVLLTWQSTLRNAVTAKALWSQDVLVAT